MPENRTYWNMDIEPLLNTPEMQKIQLKKLKIMLKRFYANAPFHRMRLEEAGLTPDNIDSRIKNLKDFAEIVPIYDKQGYRRHVEACKGDLIQLMEEEMPVSVDDLVLVNSTTGTTGEPTPYPLTEKDINDVWGEMLCRALWRGGVRKHDRLLHTFALSMVIAGTGTLMAIRKSGAMVIPVGAESGTDRIFSMAKFFKPTVFMGTPSLASYMLERHRKKSGQRRTPWGSNFLSAVGNPVPGSPNFGKNWKKVFAQN